MALNLRPYQYARNERAVPDHTTMTCVGQPQRSARGSGIPDTLTFASPTPAASASATALHRCAAAAANVRRTDAVPRLHTASRYAAVGSLQFSDENRNAGGASVSRTVFGRAGSWAPVWAMLARRWSTSRMPSRKKFTARSN